MRYDPATRSFTGGERWKENEMEHHRGISLLLLVIYNIFALAAVIYHPTRNLFILGMISPTETAHEMKQMQTCVEPAKHAVVFRRRPRMCQQQQPFKSHLDYSTKVDSSHENVEMQSWINSSETSRAVRHATFSLRKSCYKLMYMYNSEYSALFYTELCV